MALFADAALGQSLSIIRNGESEFWIKATAPQDTRYVLQASANLHLWVDINDEVSGQSSNRFDNAGVTERYFRLIPWTPPAPFIRIVLLGDSTVMDGSGWGRACYGYFKPNVQVINLAVSACSTKVFLTSDQKATMLAIKPDYVLVEFGYADTGGGDLERIYTTLPEYGDNLTTIVQIIRGFNGTPILVTPTVQRIFDDQGKVMLVFQDRYAVMKDVAAKLQTPLLDLNKLSRDLVNELGQNGSVDYYWPDEVHFRDKGAQAISRLVVNALPDSLGPYLTGIFDQPPIP